MKIDTPFWRAVRKRIVLASLLLIAINLLSLGARYNHWLELLSHFRVQYFVCGLLAIVALAILGSRRWILPLLLLVAGNAWLIAPYYTQGNEVSGGESFRVLHANVETVNTRADLLLELIKTSQPHLILLQETDARWLSDLGALEDDYETYAHVGRDDNFGIAAYSRIADTQFFIDTMKTSSLPTIRAAFKFEGQPVEILSVHTWPPMSPTLADGRNRQLIETIGLLQGMGARKALIGDLNISPWSPFFSDLKKQTGLNDARVGIGLLPSWPEHIPPLKIPIDHCLISDTLVVKHMESGPDIGSDHRPLIIDLGLIKASTQ